VVARALVGSRPPGDVLEAGTLDGWPPYASDGVGQAGIVARDDQYGVPGLVVRVPVATRDLWTSRLRLAGATAASAAELEFARIEAGRPEFLVDMDADTIPLEAGIEDRAISFSKGCYVGQEVIVRIVHRGGGRVARRLVGLRLGATAAPPARTVLRSGDKDVGRVTSAAWSPRLSCPVALGYVHRDLAQPGTALAVDCNGVSTEATVTAFPIA
jgi:folate-binding protein YgfZ